MSLSGLFRGPPPDSEEEVEDEAKRAQDTLVFAACVVGLIDGTDRLKTREGHCWKALHDNGKRRSTRSATVVERSGAVGVAILVLDWAVCMNEAKQEFPPFIFPSFFSVYSKIILEVSRFLAPP